MPKVKPLGNPDMCAAAEARRAAEKLFKDKNMIRRRINALQSRAGYENREAFAIALGMDKRRLVYILDNPESIRLSEGISLQVMARKYDNSSVFDFGLVVE